MAGDIFPGTRPGWRRLIECAEILSGGTPSKAQPSFWGGTIPWLSAKDMKSYFIEDTVDHVTELGAASGTKSIGAGGILILTRGMTLLHDLPICVTRRRITFNQDVKGLVTRENFDQRYLSYAVLAAKTELLAAVELAGHGTGRLPTDRLANLLVWVPALREQQAIAQVLGTLDDKIDLNRRTNETLEAMARALFKSWFVDFDPVRAKAKGRQPSGTDRTTAKLLPSEFEDSELGKVPKGWKIVGLDELAYFRNGLPLQRYRPSENSPRLPIVKIAQLRTGFPDFSEWASADIDPACIIEDGDVVFSWSGSLMAVVWCGGRAALNQHLFRVTSEEHPKWLYYHWLCFHLPEFQRIAGAKATTMGHIQRHHLAAARCVLPTQLILSKTSRYFEALLEKQIALQVEAKQLARVRDELLPRLLSGELSVKSAERLVGQAT